MFDLVPNDVERVVHAAFRSVPRLLDRKSPPPLSATKQENDKVQGERARRAVKMAMYLSAVDLLNARRFDEAHKALETVLSDSSNDESVALGLSLLGDALIGLGRWGEAQTAAIKAMEKDPHDILRLREHATLQVKVARERALRPEVDLQTSDWAIELQHCGMGGRCFFAHEALEVELGPDSWLLRAKRSLPRQTVLLLERPAGREQDAESLYFEGIQGRMLTAGRAAPGADLDKEGWFLNR